MKGHWLTGGGLVLSQLCMVLAGETGGDRQEKAQEGVTVRAIEKVGVDQSRGGTRQASAACC